MWYVHVYLFYPPYLFTAHSLNDLVGFLLNREGIEYVLTERFNEDSLEGFLDDRDHEDSIMITLLFVSFREHSGSCSSKFIG